MRRPRLDPVTFTSPSGPLTVTVSASTVLIGAAGEPASVTIGSADDGKLFIKSPSGPLIATVAGATASVGAAGTVASVTLDRAKNGRISISCPAGSIDLATSTSKGAIRRFLEEYGRLWLVYTGIITVVNLGAGAVLQNLVRDAQGCRGKAALGSQSHLPPRASLTRLTLHSV